MRYFRRKFVAMIAVALLLFGSFAYRPAHAQLAVVDVAALPNWVLQIQYMVQQVQIASQYLQTAIFIKSALTGPNPFASLMMVAGQLGVYQYFPPEYGGTMQGVAALGMLTVQFNRLMGQVSFLTGESFQNPKSRAATMWAWQVTSIANAGAMGRTAYGQSFARTQRIIQLNTACGASGDIMRTTGCQNRWSAEQAFLQNDANMIAASRMIQESELREGEQKMIDSYLLMGKLGIPNAPFPNVWAGRH